MTHKSPLKVSKAGINSVRKWEVLMLVGIMLAGALLRWTYLTEIVRAPDFRFPPGDGGFHDYWARSLVSGDWSALPEEAEGRDPQIRSTPYFRPPGYPYFLALIYLLSGSSYVAARVAQMVLGLVGCALAFFLGRYLFGRAVGLIVAGFMSVYWIFIHSEGKLEEAVLLVFLILCLMHTCRLLVYRITFLRLAASGVVLGLSALVRPNILLFGPVLLGWGWWLARRRKEGKRYRIMATGFILGAAVVMAPATIRNYVVSDDLVLISSNAGVNLYIGNNEFSQGTFKDDIPDLAHLRTCFDYPTVIDNLERKLGRKLKYSEVSGYFTAKAIQFMREQPLAFSKLVMKKAFLSWHPHEISHNNVRKYDRKFSNILSHIPGNFAFVLSLAVVGIGMLLFDLKRGPSGREIPQSDRKEMMSMSVLILFFILTYFASFLPFFMTSLYRIPIIPFLLLFGAYGVYSAGRLVLNRAFLVALCPVVMCTVLYGLLTGPLRPRDSANYNRDLSKWHFTRGVCYKLSGQTHLAISEYRKAVRAHPGDYRSHNNLALLLLDQGKLDEAIAHYSVALRIKPDFEEAHAGMAKLLVDRGKIDDAIGHWREALRVNPAYVPARYAMANALIKQMKLDEAIVQYTEVLRSRPNFAEAHSNLGVALATQQRYDEAITHYREALRINPNLAIAYVNIGIALECQARTVEAVESYRRALTIDPNDTSTRQRLANAIRKLERGTPNGI